MIPNKRIALQELEIAGKLNPGQWTEHSKNVALAAYHIANNCPQINADTAYVLGLLHDIGRRTGIAAVRHIIDGYDYAVSKGWGEVARICLTHSFPIKDIEIDIGKKDITPEQYKFIDQFLDSIEYDEYDKLIILCDALADANGFCILEKRFVDTTRRYGIFPFTVERWNKTIEYKEFFERMMNRSVYSVLPDIEKCIF
jgi:hypothetical protein